MSKISHSPISTPLRKIWKMKIGSQLKWFKSVEKLLVPDRISIGKSHFLRFSFKVLLSERITVHDYETRAAKFSRKQTFSQFLFTICFLLIKMFQIRCTFPISLLKQKNIFWNQENLFLDWKENSFSVAFTLFYFVRGQLLILLSCKFCRCADYSELANFIIFCRLMSFKASFYWFLFRIWLIVLKK